jgi:uncharacterized protein YceH (UPF0502 family)
VIFIYGQTTDKFNTITKSHIFTTGIAALQEVDRQLQAEKAKTSALEAQVASLESQLALLISRVDALSYGYT